MILSFADNDLLECAQDAGKAVRRWGPVVGDAYARRIKLMAQVPTFEQLRKFRTLRVHKLTARRRNTWALTLHDRWRIIVVLEADDHILIDEVNNHYGD